MQSRPFSDNDFDWLLVKQSGRESKHCIFTASSPAMFSDKNIKILFFYYKHGYLQHSNDKYEFQSFRSRILDRIRSELVRSLEKIATIPRSRTNPADSTKLLASVWSHLLNFMRPVL